MTIIKNARKISVLILYLLLIITSFASIFFYKENRKMRQANFVLKVIDGDTFLISSGEKIRLREVNASEKGLCGSFEAKRRLTQLVFGKIVRLEDKFIDRYGRVLSLVYVDKVFVNEVMLREGWARNQSQGSTKTDILGKAHSLALKEKRGIFSPLCRKEKPENPECLIKANNYPHGKKLYHFPGCSQYKQVIVEKDLGENWFCTEEEAENQGFSRASSCYGRKYYPAHLPSGNPQ